MKESAEISSNALPKEQSLISEMSLSTASDASHCALSEQNPEVASLVKRKKKNWWREVAFLFGITIFLFMIYHIGLSNIWNHIQLTGWYFFPIIGVWGIGYLLNALSWNAIIHEKKSFRIPFRRVLRYTISGYALNYITPLGLAGGEPYRIMELRRYMPTEKATSSVILYAMMHVSSHLIFWLTGAMLVAWSVPMSPILSWGLSLCVLGCCVLIFLFFRGYKQGLVVKITRIGSSFPWVGRRLRHLKPETVARLNLIDEQIRNLHGNRVRVFYFSLLMEYFSRLINSFEVLLIIYALGHPATYVDAVIVVAFSSLLANLLFFSPMQMGTREGGFYFAFSMLGLTSSISLSVSMITRIRELFWIMVGILLMKIPSSVHRVTELTKTAETHA